MFFRLGYLSDAIDVSITWDKCENCIENVKNVYNDELQKLGIKGAITLR
jgi:hypothetical protein